MCNYNVTFIAVHKHEHCNIVEHLTPSKYPELSHGLQWNLFTKVRRGEDTCGEMSYSQDQPEDGLSPVASLIKALRKWVILEPTIMLFLMSARMVYFTRLNLFLDVVCREMKNLTCDNLTQVKSHHSKADRSQCSVVHLCLPQSQKDLVHQEGAELISTVLRIENIGPILLCVLTGEL